MLAGEGGKLRPGADLFAAVDPMDDLLAAVGIVKLQDRRLGKGVGGAAARGVVGIALDLDGAAVDARDQQPQGLAGNFHRGGEALELAGHAIGRPLGKGTNFPLFPAAAGHTGQRQRRPHQLQPAPPAHALRIVDRRKLGLQKSAIRRFFLSV